jgi:hypothetical protein
MRALGLAVPALLAAALLSAGCGGSALTLDPVAAAATKTGAEGGTYTLSADAAGQSLTGNGSFDANGNTALHLQVAGQSVDARAVRTGGDLTLYVQAPLLASFLPSGKSWVAVDVSKLATKTGFDSAKALGLQNAISDPSQLLDLLGRASDGVRKAGDGTVAKGVHATHYTANLDLAKAAAEAGAPAAAAKQLQAITAKASIPVDVWVDDNGYIREVDAHVSVTGQAQQGSVSFVVTQVGAQPAVAAPPAADVYDVTGRIPTS